jgi:hypothetical protein
MGAILINTNSRQERYFSPSQKRLQIDSAAPGQEQTFSQVHSNGDTPVIQAEKI